MAAPAAAAIAAGRTRLLRRLLPILIAAAFLPFLVLVGVVSFFGETERRCAIGGYVPGPNAKAGKIPAKVLRAYMAAGESYGVDWRLLAGIGWIETKHGADLNVSSAGALGWMQFMPATWDAYGVDADGDGRRDPWTLEDAIHGAANYMRTLLRNAKGDVRKALWGYNHSWIYVNDVLAAARGYGYGTSPAEVDAPRDPKTPMPGPDGARMTWPTEVHTVSSPFGMRLHPVLGIHRMHEGLDIGAPHGAPVSAVMTGRIVFRGAAGGYGNYLCLSHSATLTTCYAHLSRFGAGTVGATVEQGTVIGYVGNTGIGTGAHLHFEVRVGPTMNSPAVDPVPYLQGAATPDGAATQPGIDGCAIEPTDGEQTGNYTGGQLAWPTKGGSIIGWPFQGTHTLGNWQSDNALDISIPVGTPVYAVDDGQVCTGCGFGSLNSTNPAMAGLRLTLTIAGNQIYYAHLSRFADNTRPGAAVKRGQILGFSGSANSAPHLHIAVQNGSPDKLMGAQR